MNAIAENSAIGAHVSIRNCLMLFSKILAVNNFQFWDIDWRAETAKERQLYGRM